jgi:hypothetical protein
MKSKLIIVVVCFTMFSCMVVGYKNPKLYGYVLNSDTLEPIDNVLINTIYSRKPIQALTNEMGYFEYPRGKKFREWITPFLEGSRYSINLVLQKEDYISDTMYFDVWLNQEGLDLDTLYLTKIH